MIPLLQLLDDFRRLLAAGSAAAAADGLRRSARALRDLVAGAPALARLAGLTERAAGAGPADAPTAVSDLLLALLPARSALATAGAAGELTPVEASGPWATATPAADLYRIVGAVNRTLPNRAAILRAAAENGRVADLRLVGPLLRCLRAANSEVALLAAQDALPAFGPAVLPEVLAGLNLRGKAADAHALLAVCRIDRKQGHDWCRRALAEGNAYMRVQALRWCLHLVAPAAEVVRTAREWLARDRNWRRRQQAAEALCQVGPAAAPAVPELVAALAEGPLSLTDAVARALAAVGPPAVPPLTDALRSDNPAVRRGAALSLGRLRERANTPAAVTALHEALRDGDEKVRAAAVEALVAVAPESPETVAALVARLKEPNPATRVLATICLDHLGPPARAAIPALLEALEDPDASVRGHAALALKTHCPDKASAVPVLVRALREDSNHYVRGTAAEILGELGRRARPAAPALVAALQDPQGHVRSSAAAALRQVGAGPAVAVPALAALLPHPQEWCRLAAMRALARFGRRARAAIPALTALLQTEANDYVRREAEETLAIVRGQATLRW